MARPARRESAFSRISGPKAALLLFALIVLQIPAFRGICGTKTCNNPLELAVIHAATVGEWMPPMVAAAVLYPGAALRDLAMAPNGSRLVDWNELVKSLKPTEGDAESNKEDNPHNLLKRLEVVIGAYFIVAGSLSCLFQPSRLSFIGVMLLLWGLAKHGFLKPPQHAADPPPEILATAFLQLFAAYGASVKRRQEAVVQSQADEREKKTQ